MRNHNGPGVSIDPAFQRGDIRLQSFYIDIHGNGLQFMIFYDFEHVGNVYRRDYYFTALPEIEGGQQKVETRPHGQAYE
jgi:hypothetical protein